MLADLARAVREGIMSSGQAAARLAPQLTAGEITIRDAIDVVLPFGFAGLFVEGSVTPEELARYEVMLIDLVDAFGLERTVEQLEKAVVQNREDVAQGREGRWLREAPREVRWVGGRRELVATGGASPIRGTWIAWEVEGVHDGVVALEVFDDDVEVAAEAQLRSAIEQHRGAAAEPKGGLVTDDAMLTAIAFRVVGDAYPVGAAEADPSIEPTWIDFRVQLGLKLRRPIWWLRSGTPEVIKFLKCAARLLAAAPWECPDRMAVLIQIEGRQNAIFRPRDDEFDVDARAVVFTIGDRGPGAGLDLLVVSFVEESFAPGVREHVRPELLAAGWHDARRYPHLQIHRDGEVEVELEDADFDHASALCGILLQAIADMGQRTEGLLERSVELDEFPDVAGRYTVFWYET